MVADLFGVAEDPLEKTEEAIPSKQEDGEKLESEGKVTVEKYKEKQSPLIPDDPFDDHLDDQKPKVPVWVDEDDYNIR